MKFSVLIPVYNTGKYLEECLQSVLNQTYQNFEIIIVDDGSTDNSGTICDKFQKDYPQIIKVIHKENQGQLASRCIAIQHAKGDYCIFVDADDLLCENALEIIIDNLHQYGFPDMLIYSFFYENEKGDIRKAKRFFDEGLVESEKLHEMFFTGTGLNNVWTKAVKIEIARCKGFDFSNYFSLRCAEDSLQSMAMVDGCQTVVYIYKQLYRYRIWNFGTTRRYTLDRISIFNDTILHEKRLCFAKKWGMNFPEWRDRIEAYELNHLVYVFDLFYVNGDRVVRKNILDYHWIDFIPRDVLIDTIDSNEYISTINHRLLRWLLGKQWFCIWIYYRKKLTYQFIRRLKKRVLTG